MSTLLHAHAAAYNPRLPVYTSSAYVPSTPEATTGGYATAHATAYSPSLSGYVSSPYSPRRSTTPTLPHSTGGDPVSFADASNALAAPYSASLSLSSPYSPRSGVGLYSPRKTTGDHGMAVAETSKVHATPYSAGLSLISPRKSKGDHDARVAETSNVHATPYSSSLSVYSPSAPLTTTGQYDVGFAEAYNAAEETVTKFEYDFSIGGVWKTEDIKVRIARSQFTEGTFRKAHKMVDAEGRQFVAKTYKRDTSTDEIKGEVVMQAICQHYGRRFSKTPAPQKVEYLQAFAIQRSKEAGGEMLFCEPYMRGEFRKYNDNRGATYHTENHAPQAFSHFSYVSSQGKLLVVDVQGVGDQYTDSTIHSSDQRYGAMDWGPDGFRNFFSTHTCNAICDLLGLSQKLLPDAPAGPASGLYMCGSNCSGQLGTGAAEGKSGAAGMEDYSLAHVGLDGPPSAVALGEFHSAAIVNKRLYMWGQNAIGQLGIGLKPDERRPSRVPLKGAVSAVALGRLHSAAIVGGQLYTWGYNNKGQLGNGGTRSAYKPQLVALKGAVSAVALGGHHSAAIVERLLYVWGHNDFGQLGLGHTKNALTPQRVTLCGPVTAVALGDQHSAALVGPKLYVWGRNRFGQLGLGTTAKAETPTLVAMPGPVSAVALGYSHSAALTGGCLYMWGRGQVGQLGLCSDGNFLRPERVPFHGWVRAVALGGNHSCALVGEQLYLWGDSSGRVVSLVPKLWLGFKEFEDRSTRVVGIAAGGTHSAVVLEEDGPEQREQRLKQQATRR